LLTFSILEMPTINLGIDFKDHDRGVMAIGLVADTLCRTLAVDGLDKSTGPILSVLKALLRNDTINGLIINLPAKFS
jgi:hypothetical protein